MRRTLATIAAAAASLSLALAGCGLGDEPGADPAADRKAGKQAGEEAAKGKVTGSVSLQTWSLKPKFTSYVQNLIDGFEKKYPGTKVTWLDQPGDGYSEKVLSQASSGKLPDVTNLPPDFAAPLVEQGMLLDIEAADPELRKEYVAGGVEAYAYPGRQGVFGYPWYLNTDVNYWNGALLKKYGLDPAKLPSDLDGLIAQARVMKAKSGGRMFLMSRKPGLGDFTNEGVKILSDDGEKFVFNTPEAVALLDKYRRAYADGLLPAAVLTDEYLGNSALFTKGKVAWTTGGGNFINDVKQNNPSVAKDIVTSPAMNTPPLYVQGVSISKRSKNLPAALALARWVTSPENQKEFAKQVPGIFPSTTASASDPSFSKSDGTPAEDAKVIAFDSLAKAKLLQPVTIDQAMNDVIGQQITLAMKGDVTSKEALDKAVERCNQLLRD